MNDGRLTTEDVEALRRSTAMSAELPPDELRRLLDDHRELLHRHDEIAALLAELEPRFRAVREILNRLHRLLERREPDR